RPISELGPGPVAGHVDVHGGQAEAPLQWTLNAPDALCLGQWDPGRGPVQPTSHADGMRLVMTRREEVKAQRRLVAGAAWGRRPHRVRTTHEANDELPGIGFGADREER